MASKFLMTKLLFYTHLDRLLVIWLSSSFAWGDVSGGKRKDGLNNSLTRKTSFYGEKFAGVLIKSYV